MPNRLTATDKWRDPWFCSLTPQDKLFWLYVCDNCDHAGIWQVNWPLVKFHLGDYQFKQEIFNGRIEYISEEIWFLKKFVLFQQRISSINELNPKNKCHFSIINILSGRGILSPLEGASKPLARGHSIVKYSNSNSKVKAVIKGFSAPTLEEVKSYCLERKNTIDPQYFFDRNQATGWVDKNGNKYKDWKSVIRTWERWDNGIKTDTRKFAN